MKKVMLIVIAVFLLHSCSYDEREYYDLAIQLNYEVDGEDLDFNEIAYTNEAGNTYSVVRLEYYLSEFRLRREDGSELLLTDQWQYVNAREAGRNSFSIKKIPAGYYHSISFLVGLPPDKNKTEALPGTMENINMAWPDQMGGGYHFMKLEGHFNDTGSSTGTSGYAMHLGNDKNLVKVTPIPIMMEMDNNKQLKLTMNINEWYANPHLYDFNVDGNYSMTDMPAMMKLSANGKNVFKAHVIP